MNNTNNQPTRVERVKEPARMYANPVERERLIVEKALREQQNDTRALLHSLFRR